MKKAELKQAEQRRQQAEHDLATMRATTEAKALQRSLSLLEAPQPVTVPWTEYPAFDAFGSLCPARERPYYWTNIDDRTEGRYRPIYETDQDLRMMRAESRRMQAMFPVAESALESLTDYVVLGYQFTVQPRVKGTENSTGQLVAQVQKVVDKFLDRTNFIDNLDREIFKQSRGDGESFPTLYIDDGCKIPEVRLELTQPDYILAPLEERPLNNMLRMGHKLNYWYHGVHTTFSRILKREDVTRPHGYHAVFDRTGDQWDYLPEARVEHIKRNVGLDGRRGVSDFFSITPDLEREAKIRRNTAEGAAILAAIVEIRQYAEGTTKTAIESMAGGSVTSTYDRQVPSGSKSVISQQVTPGTVRHVPFGQTSMLGAMGTLRSPVYMEVCQFLLRIIGNRWHFPEFMSSGDASNNNLASSITATEPFERFCEANQYVYGQHYKNLIWKALRIYHAIGRFGGISWRQLCDAIDISFSCKSPAIRDPLQRAQANQIMHSARVMSTRSWQVDAGLDPDEEDAELKTEPPPSPPVATPFGHQDAGAPKLESLAARALRSLAKQRE